MLSILSGASNSIKLICESLNAQSQIFVTLCPLISAGIITFPEYPKIVTIIVYIVLNTTKYL